MARVFRQHKEAGTILRKVGLYVLLDQLFVIALYINTVHEHTHTHSHQQQVALDQLVFGPISNVIMMSYISMAIEGRSWGFTQRKIKRDYPSLQINGWKVWIGCVLG